jgi:transposase
MRLPCGFPRVKTPKRWQSIQHPVAPVGPSAAMWGSTRRAPIGRCPPTQRGRLLKIKQHRPLEGTPVTAHLVVRVDRHWYAVLVGETLPQDALGAAHPSPTQGEHPAIGLDGGRKVFLADSAGGMVETPRPSRRGQKRLAPAQRRGCRRHTGSHRRRCRKAGREVACKPLTMSRPRRDFHVTTPTRSAAGYRRLCVCVCECVCVCVCVCGEDRHGGGMVRNHQLATSMHDARGSAFLDRLSDTAERAGHQVIRVPARFTTQNWRRCGAYVQKSLSVRTPICPCGGVVEDRAVNAASNLLQAGAPPSGTASRWAPGCTEQPPALAVGSCHQPIVRVKQEEIRSEIGC